MENRYQSEIDEFHKNFDCFCGKKIVLYGIGRYTATLIDGVHNHLFIGLLDKDPDNIGKVMFGLPVLAVEDAEKQADMIIINTSGTYWNVIYQRIKGIKIPVYFLNGRLADEETIPEIDTTYWNSSLEELHMKIEQSDAVSFDFFDTLFSRKLSGPVDVFAILEKEIKAEEGIDVPYRELRSKALQSLKSNYTLNGLYREISGNTELGEGTLKNICNREIRLEKELLTPRKTMCDCLKYAARMGKEIYVISDMYLPKSFFVELLREWNLEVKEENILVSCEEGSSKVQGDIWEKYKNIIQGKKALHIGDDFAADVEMPQKYGIETYFIASQIKMLRLSMLREIECRIVNEDTSYFMGLVLNKMFDNPFELNAGRGKIIIKSAFDMGYLVFGPVIYTFLEWLTNQAREDGIKRLVFMSRDGYFLKEDYKLYCDLRGTKINCCYMGISRQLAMTASIQTEEDLYHFMKVPYSGPAAELLEDRFHIRITEEERKGCDISDLYKIYKEQIWEYVNGIRINYLNYLKSMKLDHTCAVVDLGYYGNNQRYLNELTGQNIKGYYFNADLSPENVNSQKAVMKACFQSEEDSRGQESQIREKMIFIESFLTAPYGMIKAIDEKGDFLYAPKGENQKKFGEKEKINEGVKQFVRDCCENKYMKTDNKLIGFTDYWYGLCMSGKMGFTKEIKTCFYNDNALMNRLESMLFY